MTELRSLPSFGDVAAEDDEVLKYFVTTDAVSKIENGKVLLVLGRKGTGKTAILRYFTEKNSDGSAKALSLKKYPWNAHATRRDYGASEIEAYVSSWRYLIAVELATLLLKDPYARRAPSTIPLRTFLEDNYGGVSPDLGDILRVEKLKLNRVAIAPRVLGNQLFEIEFNRKKSDTSFGFQLDAVTDEILKIVNNVSALLNYSSLNLHFDELDQGLSEINQTRSNMIIGLILAARDIKSEFSDEKFSINPLIYLRTDIWNALRFSDKNKINQTSSLVLEWDSATLKKLVNERISKRLDEKSCWETISDSTLMRGAQKKWDHILARTFLRPRDVIQFLNIILGVFKSRESGENIFVNQDVVNAREAYSAYLRAELEDEIGPHWPEWGQALQACSELSKITFQKDDFDREFSKRKNSSGLTTDEALEKLYNFSVIGYQSRSGYGGSKWRFQYSDPDSGWDQSATQFKVHLGLKETAKLQEGRKGS